MLTKFIMLKMCFFENKSLNQCRIKLRDKVLMTRKKVRSVLKVELFRENKSITHKKRFKNIFLRREMTHFTRINVFNYFMEIYGKNKENGKTVITKFRLYKISFYTIFCFKTTI